MRERPPDLQTGTKESLRLSVEAIDGGQVHIAFVTSLYPSESRPNYGTFVQQLVWEIARRGVKCTVVAPTSMFQRRWGPLNPRHETECPVEGAVVQVLRPRFLSASSKQIWRYNTDSVSYRGFAHAARAAMTSMPASPDVLYGHFLFPSGRLVASLAGVLDKPAFSAHGDDCIEGPDLDRGGKDLVNLTGIIAVSERNKRFCEGHLGFPSERIAVFANGVNRKVFYPREKEEMKRKHGLSLDRVLVAFAGHFIKRKGPDRVLEAIGPLPGVEAVMMGAGPIRLESDKIAFKGSVPSQEVAELLSACDMFVLPTLNEGCCNAILEAFACGLPVISSRGDFNDEILDESVGIRVDPMSVEEIRSAVAQLAEDSALRLQLSYSALEHAKCFDLEKRAKGIIGWIERMCADTRTVAW